MARTVARAAAWLGWIVLGAVALAGLALSSVALLMSLPVTREAIASRVVRVVDDAIAGTVKLSRIVVLPHGGIELRGLEVLDPQGRLVLSAGRARVSADITALRARTIGIAVELDAPSVLLEEEREGGLSLARAFAPSRPSAPKPGAGAGAGGGGGRGGGTGGWTIQVSRVAIRGGQVWWVDPAGKTRLEADDLAVDARGTFGPGLSRVELRLDGELRDPIASPLALEVVAVRAASAVRVPVLRLEAGGSFLDLVAEGDLAQRRGRLALRRLAIARQEARALLKRAPHADVNADGYAESDGEMLTAAVDVEPKVRGAAGSGSAAVAARLPSLRRALGFDVALDRFDPSAVASGAPAGELTLTAQGAAAGRSLDDVRAQLALSASRSRLRGGEITRAEVQLRAAPGTLEVARLGATAPGFSFSGAGRWRRGGPVSGSARLDAPDVALAARNAARLLGKAVPALSGSARIAAELSGTSAAPALAGSLDAGVLRAGTSVAEGVRLTFAGTGPLDALDARAEGNIARLARGARDMARQVSLRAALHGGEGTLSIKGSVPGAGKGQLAVDGRGRLGPRHETLLLDQLVLAWPGARWSLARPATVDLRTPSVDRLELDAGAQRIALVGGLRPRGRIDARFELSRFDLARLPPGVLPEEGLRGVVSASLEASGTTAKPAVQGRFGVEGGAARGLTGLSSVGEAGFDGARRRATLTLSVVRADGGTVDVALDAPVPLAGRPGEPLKARIRAAALPIPDLLRAAGRQYPAAGTVSLDVNVEGKVGAPVLSGELAVADGAWRDLDGLGLTVTVEEDQGRGALRVVGSGSLADRRVLALAAEAPVDVGELLARPAQALRAIARAKLEATADVSALDLSAVAGRAGTAPGLAGVVSAHVAVTGPLSTPRGQATLDLAEGSWKGWRAIGAHIALAATDAGIATSGTIAASGHEALRFEGSLAVRPERLARRDAFLAAPLRLEATIPRVALEPIAGGSAPLSGILEGHLSASGTPRAPEIAADLAGTGVLIEGRPLGEMRASARYSARQGHAEVVLRPSTGGSLRATLALTGDLGAGAGKGALRAAQAEARVTGEAVGLEFLAAIAPTRIRTASGQLALDVTAKGTLARLSPRGEVHVSNGRIAISELGDFTDIALDARVTDNAIELSRFEVRRGSGRLSANASVTGLREATARVAAALKADGFTISRAGMDLATIRDFAVEANGTLRGSDLSVDVKVPHGEVRLPKKSPRTLQSLQERKDIAVGYRAEQREKENRPRAAPTAPAAELLAVHVFPGVVMMLRTLEVHLVVPHRLFVKGEEPKMNVELKADTRYKLSGHEESLQGTVEVVRGFVEPLSRHFNIERGVMRFTGGAWKDGEVEVVAKYQNPSAVVTASVTGRLSNISLPRDLKLTSVPEMTETQIALLLTTGRTQLKPGSETGGALTGEEAGNALLGALATQFLQNVVQQRVPIDVLQVGPGGVLAGDYLSDKLYLEYARRFDADPTKNENTDEVRVEYRFSRRWMLESRYGNAQSGGVSIIWSESK